MISPWTVYWVMTLDSLCMFLGGVGIVALVAGATGTIVRLIASAEPDGYGNGAAIAGTTWAHKTLAASLAALLVATLLPSSKTAAAMILVPALTSDQVMEPVGKEAKELYTLAKSALANLADKQAEPKAEEPSK